MANPTGIGGVKKGDASRNPGGMTREEREAREELRLALAKDKDEIHAALMYLVKERNPQAVMYAHQQLAGKPLERHELTGAEGRDLFAAFEEIKEKYKLSDGDISAYLKGKVER